MDHETLREGGGYDNPDVVDPTFGTLAGMDDLVSRTRAWIAGDPDPETRDELTRLRDDVAKSLG